MSSASFKRHAFKTLLFLHFIGLTLVIGVRFANFAIEYVTSADSLQVLAGGRDLMGILAKTLTAPGFWLTVVSGIGMVVLRYGKNVPGWVWGKIALTVAGMVLALTKVAPALEAARRWAHESAQLGHFLPQLHDSLGQAALYGGVTFTLILLTVPVAVWKPRRQRVPIVLSDSASAH
jgi:xanthine/uracil/vitamin C permease (AzgA family)